MAVITCSPETSQTSRGRTGRGSSLTATQRIGHRDWVTISVKAPRIKPSPSQDGTAQGGEQATGPQHNEIAAAS